MEIPLHAVLVHFPIALFVTSVILDGLGLLLRRPRLHDAAWINLLLSGIGVILAVASGLLEKSVSDVPPPARSVLETHETLAFFIAAILLGLLLWRWGKNGNLPTRFRSLYLIVSLIGLIVLYIGSAYGGKLVYQHGVGRRQSGSIRTAPAEKKTPSPDSPQILFYPDADTLR